MNKKELIKLCERLYNKKDYGFIFCKTDDSNITVETYDSVNDRMTILFNSPKGNIVCLIDGTLDEITGELIVYFYGDTVQVLGQKE